MQKGNGDKYIMLTDDEECNGIHGCYYSFCECEEIDEVYGLDPKECIILG